VTSSITGSSTGFFISDAGGGAHSGMWVYAPFVEGLSLSPGDRITITGLVSEYGGSSDESGDTGMSVDVPDTETQTQLSIVSADAVVGTGVTDMPPATMVTGETFATAESAEPFEGVLVMLEDVIVTSPYVSGGFGVDDGAQIGDLFVNVSDVRLGDTFGSITGLVYFNDGVYEIEPRDTADLVGHMDSCGTCTADMCMTDVEAGDIVIAELMVDPNAGTDFVAEYIEVYNNTAGSVDLNCLTLTDGSLHFGYIEASTVVSAGGVAVLTRRSLEGSTYSDAIAASGAPTASYRKSVSLNNDSDTLTLTYETTVIDAVVYDSAFPISAGASIEVGADSLSDGASLNDFSDNWCAATSIIAPWVDLGSPGVVNGVCGSVLDL
jgi:hypothetical protein